MQQAKQALASARAEQAVALLARCLELWPGDREAFSMLASLSRHNQTAANIMTAMRSVSSVLQGDTLHYQR